VELRTITNEARPSPEGTALPLAGRVGAAVGGRAEEERVEEERAEEVRVEEERVEEGRVEEARAEEAREPWASLQVETEAAEAIEGPGVTEPDTEGWAEWPFAGPAMMRTEALRLTAAGPWP